MTALVLGPVPTDTGASEGGGGASSGSGGGCAGAPNGHAPMLALVVALLAAVHLRRRLSGCARNAWRSDYRA
ncbi:MAG: MYXO-CTERM sorting domain-containing protein [Myxococcota bacterium]